MPVEVDFIEAIIYDMYFLPFDSQALYNPLAFVMRIRYDGLAARSYERDMLSPIQVAKLLIESITRRYGVHEDNIVQCLNQWH